MQEPFSHKRTRDLAFLVSGLTDLFLGVLLLLVWFDLLPFDLVALGIPRWLVGLIGAGLSVSGVVLVVYMLTKIREPE